MILPSSLPGCTIDRVIRSPDRLVVLAHARRDHARCPACGTPSSSVHSRYDRRPADLLNMRQAFERWLARAHGRLRGPPLPPEGDGRQPGQRLQAYRRSAAEIAGSRDSRDRWLAVYEDVRRRHLAGETLLAIGRATGLARRTVRKFAHAESFPERAIRRPNPSRLDPYLSYLERRMVEGCENAMALWREVRGQGFAGSHRQVHRFVAERRAVPARRTARKWLSCAAPISTEVNRRTPIPSPKQLAWFLVQPTATLPSHTASALGRIRQDVEAMRVSDLAGQFTTLVRACGIDGDRPSDATAVLDAWLADARTCGITALETFAAGLAQDGAAVRAALTTPWSNAQAEGQISRLKMLKRTMYVRAGFALLRRRIILAA